MDIYIKQPRLLGHAAAEMADGILIVDKPEGLTSHDVVARLRRILRTRRVGHTGTLDPFATGVLVICLNRATRLAQFLSGDEKEYLATLRLGYGTDTGDLTGTALTPANDARHISPESLQAALVHFRGRIQQVPPMYSAKKVGGVRLYDLARRGEAIARQPIEVEIKQLELCPLEANSNLMFCDHPDGTRDFKLRVVCSAGTYVRTLAEDIGRELGLGAHLAALRRTRAGDCRLEQAVTLQRLAEMAEAGTAWPSVIPMARALTLPALQVNESERVMLTHGRAIARKSHWPKENWRDGERIKLCHGEATLLAIAEYDQRAELLRPRLVLSEA